MGWDSIAGSRASSFLFFFCTEDVSTGCRAGMESSWAKMGQLINRKRMGRKYLHKYPVGMHAKEVLRKFQILNSKFRLFYEVGCITILMAIKVNIDKELAGKVNFFSW